MQRGFSKILVGAVAAGALVALAGCAPSASTGGSAGDSTGAASVTMDEAKQYASAQEVIDSYDITELCGDKELTIAFPAGIVNAWMSQTYEMIKEEAKKCPNIKDVQIVDAGVDQQKAVSDVNSLVAQGVSGIVTLPIFGAAQVPSFKKAQDAGVPVVTFVSDSSGKVGSDISQHVSQDLEQYGKGWADWLNTNMKKGTVVFLGNAAGQPSSQSAFDAFKAAIAEYPDITLVEDEYIPTDNSAVTKKQQMTAMLAKHGRIDAVISDNGAIDSSVIDAYNQAGMELPYIADANATNGLACAWEKQNFPLFSWDGSNDEGVVALRHLLSAINGIPTSEPDVVKPFVSIDTFAGPQPVCDPSVSPDADWSTGLDAATMTEILG
jgi:ribose transport system substrate-binding protein